MTALTNNGISARNAKNNTMVIVDFRNEDGSIATTQYIKNNYFGKKLYKEMTGCELVLSAGIDAASHLEKNANFETFTITQNGNFTNVECFGASKIEEEIIEEDEDEEVDAEWEAQLAMLMNKERVNF